jgi:hypothetical protein
MANDSDYILFRPEAAPSGKTRETPPSNKVYPLTQGLWQQETLDTLRLYGDKEAGFTAVPGKEVQLSLFPMDEVAAPAQAKKATATEDPAILIPHWSNFKFFSEDTLRLARKLKDIYLPRLGQEAPSKPAARLSDLAPVGDKPIYDPQSEELKADQFPDRIRYTEGGLYSSKDPKVQENAPNYRKMPDKPVHGVGQPTRQGFEDVIKKMDGKPVIWANTRAEGVIYVEGKPYNLRQMEGMENVDLKQGASAQQVEAMEDKLKQELMARGTIKVAEEVPVLGPDNKPVKENGRLKTQRVTREVKLTAENLQTTRDVVEGLQAKYPNFEYRRIPLSDEKSPHPGSVEAVRDFMNEMAGKYGDKDPQYVFNCHQGKGRTTTAMVAAGITLDGKGPRQLELPFDDARERAERNIKDNAQMQNLKTTVGDYQRKSQDASSLADRLSTQAAGESDPAKKKDLEEQAGRARSDAARNAENAQEFTKRYALLQKYSDYVTDNGSTAKEPGFDEWMKDSGQQADLQDKWASLNKLCGLDAPLQTVQATTAYA